MDFVIKNVKENILYGNILLNTFYDGYYYNKHHRNLLKNDYDFCFKNKLVYLYD